MSESDEQHQATPAPFYGPQPTVFTGHTRNPDHPGDDGPNSLSIETVEGEDSDGGLVGLVRVETNYKPHGRTGDTYPVNLTMPDAVKAAAALLSTVTETLAHTLDGALDVRESVRLLSLLRSVDDALDDLRTQLVHDVGLTVDQPAVN
jgi:hypothetical protein